MGSDWWDLWKFPRRAVLPFSRRSWNLSWVDTTSEQGRIWSNCEQPPLFESLLRKKKLSPLHLPTIFSHQTYAKEYARAPPRKRVSVDDPTNTLFRVFGLRFEVPFAGVVGVRTLFWKSQTSQEEMTKKDPLPAVSCSNVIIRWKELFERAVGKSC